MAKPLEQRQREVLAALEMLSEARAARLESRTSQSKPSDQAPAGYVEGKLNMGQIRDRSLWDYYRLRFQEVQTNDERRLVVECAEMDYELRRRGPSGVLLYEPGVSDAEAAAQRVKRDEKLVLMSKSLSLRIAYLKHWKLGWVQEVRRRAGLHPETGESLPEWRIMTDEQRAEVVGEMASEGLSQRQVAYKLLVGKTSVHRYWPTRLEKVA